MRKIIHLEPHDALTGEATVQPAILWANGRPCYEGISKHASVGSEYFKTVTPVPGHSFVYVIALGAWETYGENRNGDSFPEFPYKDTEKPPWIAQADVLTAWYKTFEQFGYNYRHHKNKDPNKAVGKVKQAFWNPVMHRVELLIDLEDAKAPDLAERIAAGEFPPVSMGTRVKYDVCVLPNTLVRTSKGYQEIQDICEGDYVRSHTGALQKVKTHFVHTVRDDTLKIKAASVPEINCTTQHPFLVVRKNVVRTCQGSADGERLRHKFSSEGIACTRCNKSINISPEWVAAEDLRIGDYVVTPVDTCNSKSTVGKNAARSLGFYVGDGCLIKNAKGDNPLSGFAISLDVGTPTIMNSLIECLTPISENAPNVYKDNGDGVSVRVYDQGLATWLLEHGGEYSRKKRLAEEVFAWSKEEKTAFISGYIDSDGSYDPESGSIRIATVNRGLALDTQRVLHSLRIPASVSYGGHTTNATYGSDTDYWYVFIPAAHATEFVGVSVRATGAKGSRWTSSKSFFTPDYWCAPIQAISELPGAQEVHNLAVEEDESYVAEGIAVHNCSICGNRAPTRAQYCDHLKFQMREVLPDGRKVSALNPSPKFFDISWVFRPADPTAYMLKKVAYDAPYELSGAAAGEYLDSLDERKLASQKMAVMDKVVQGYPVDAKTDGVSPMEINNLQKIRDAVLTAGDNTPDIPDDTLRSMSQHPLQKVFSTLFSTGCMLNTPEVVKIIIYKGNPKAHVDNDHLDRAVALQRSILELFGDVPQLFDKMNESGVLDIDPKHVDIKIAELMGPYLEKRSGIGDYLHRRFVPDALKIPDPLGQATQSLTISDPVSGTRYRTTRGAALRAHDEIAKRNLYKVLGGALLLGGAYKYIGSGLLNGPNKKLRPLLGLTLGALGASQWPSMGPHYMTDQGVPVPTLTELAHDKTGSLAVPLLGTLATMALLSHDYKSRMRRGEPVGHPALPFSRRILDRGGQFVGDHPLISALAGTTLLHGASRTRPMRYLAKDLLPSVKRVGQNAYRGGKGAVKEFVEGVKMSSWLENELPASGGTVTLPDIDMDRIAEKIGKLVVEG